MATDPRTFDIKMQSGFSFMALVVFCLSLSCPLPFSSSMPSMRAKILRSGKGFSLRWFAAAWANDAVQEAALRSLYLALVAATIASIVATMAAIATTRTDPYRGLTFKYAMINQPLMVPEIVTAVALLIVFSRIKVWTGYSGLAICSWPMRPSAFPLPICRSGHGSRTWT